MATLESVLGSNFAGAGLFLVTCCLSVPIATSLNIGVLLPWEREGNIIGSAITTGFSAVRDQDLLPGQTLNWQWRDTECTSRIGMHEAVRLWLSFGGDVDAFIGGGCDSVCQNVALLSGAIKAPFVSYGCTGTAMSDKGNYPTFTRTVPILESLAPLYGKLALELEWKTIGILATTETIMQSTANSIKQEIQANNGTTYKQSVASVFNSTGHIIVENQEKLKESLKLLSTQARGRGSTCLLRIQHCKQSNGI